MSTTPPRREPSGPHRVLVRAADVRPQVLPQNPCTPDSDINSGAISDPNAAGSAFMELQLYPPGYTPFVDGESCSKTKWCAALTIDSLECNFNFASGALCEFADGYRFPKGARTALVNGVPTTEFSDANQCFQTRFQNGDLDFDGLSYIGRSWPDGTRDHPTAFQYVGPFQRNGKPYPQIQFESNVGGSSALCNTTTGAGCTQPPIGAEFYPFWSLSPSFAALGSFSTRCVRNFGNVLPTTIRMFGKDAQYGTPDVARFAVTSTSATLPNPQFAGGCKR